MKLSSPSPTDEANSGSQPVVSVFQEHIGISSLIIKYITLPFASVKGATLGILVCLFIGGGTIATLKLTSTNIASKPHSPAISTKTGAKTTETVKANSSTVSSQGSKAPAPPLSSSTNPTSTPKSSTSPISTKSSVQSTASSATSNSGSTPSAPTNSNPTSSSGGSSPPAPSYPGCTYNGVVAPCIGSTTAGASGWGSPVFDDEFNGSSVNTSVWNVTNNWTNQNGVTTSSSNVSVSGGYLVLNLASSSSGAELETSSYGLPVGGFAEARIDFPGNGTQVYNWPAWWASGPNWPTAGEADIFEGLGSASTNYHYYSNGDQQSGPFFIPGTWTNSFHILGLYRGSNYNDVYWDGNLIKSYPTYDDGQAETLILTLGSGNTAAYGTSSHVLVDYVRAWQ